jgi:hypothetical protein
MEKDELLWIFVHCRTIVPLIKKIKINVPYNILLGQ